MNMTDKSTPITPETSYPAIMGAILVDKRKKMGLDQANLAKKVGVSRPTWSRIENGEIALGVDQLLKVAEVLEYKGGISQLIQDTDKVADQMRQQGVTVHHERISPAEKTTLKEKKSPKNKVVQGLSLLSTAALALWIAHVLMRK